VCRMSKYATCASCRSRVPAWLLPSLETIGEVPLKYPYSNA
jgi:hypothetical protein